MRAFIAVDVPTVTVRGAATGSEAQPSHLTLQFLGEVPDPQAEAIARALAPVAARTAPFDVVLEGVGAFPSPARPRVVFVGMGRGGRELVALAAAVAEATRPLGFLPEPRPFVPHVTLVRVRSSVERELALDLLDRPPAGPLAEGRVDALLLKQSRLGRAGAVHRVVARLPLGGASA